MPKISVRGLEMPQSPIRKLAPLANAAKERGIKVYHLNIGQPDLPTPQVAIDAIHNIDMSVLEYSPSQGYKHYREKLVNYYKSYNIHVTADDIIITSGGQGPAEVISEGEAMRNYMISCGISEDRIVAETNSTTTIENFGFSMNIVTELEGTEDASGVEIVYVTNSYHCFRSGLDAHIAGFQEAHPLASKTPTALILQSYFRETFSLLKLAFNELVGALR